MPKRSERWPIWKIAVATAGCALLAGGLPWLSRLAEKVGGEPTTLPSGRQPALTVSSFVMMMAIAAGICPFTNDHISVMSLPEEGEG